MDVIPSYGERRTENLIIEENSTGSPRSVHPKFLIINSPAIHIM
jgi:hypothetical protein